MEVSRGAASWRGWHFRAEPGARSNQTRRNQSNQTRRNQSNQPIYSTNGPPCHMSTCSNQLFEAASGQVSSQSSWLNKMPCARPRLTIVRFSVVRPRLKLQTTLSFPRGAGHLESHGLSEVMSRLKNRSTRPSPSPEVDVDRCSGVFSSFGGFSPVGLLICLGLNPLTWIGDGSNVSSPTRRMIGNELVRACKQTRQPCKQMIRKLASTRDSSASQEAWRKRLPQKDIPLRHLISMTSCSRRCTRQHPNKHQN